jgi:hypothetical protein
VKETTPDALLVNVLVAFPTPAALVVDAVDAEQPAARRTRDVDLGVWRITAPASRCAASRDGRTGRLRHADRARLAKELSLAENAAGTESAQERCAVRTAESRRHVVAHARAVDGHVVEVVVARRHVDVAGRGHGVERGVDESQSSVGRCRRLARPTAMQRAHERRADGGAADRAPPTRARVVTEPCRHRCSTG